MATPVASPVAKVEAPGIDAAYRHVIAFTHSHYENFPVASRLLPPRLKPTLPAPPLHVKTRKLSWQRRRQICTTPICS